MSANKTDLATSWRQRTSIKGRWHEPDELTYAHAPLSLDRASCAAICSDSSTTGVWILAAGYSEGLPAVAFTSLDGVHATVRSICDVKDAVTQLSWAGNTVATAGMGVLSISSINWQPVPCLNSIRAVQMAPLHVQGCVAVSPSGRELIASFGQITSIFSVDSPDSCIELPVTESPATCIAWDAQGGSVVTSYADGGLTILDTRTEGVSTIRFNYNSAIATSPAHASSVCFSPHCSFLVYGTSYDGSVKVWDIRNSSTPLNARNSFQLRPAPWTHINVSPSHPDYILTSGAIPSLQIWSLTADLPHAVGSPTPVDAPTTVAASWFHPSVPLACVGISTSGQFFSVEIPSKFSRALMSNTRSSQKFVIDDAVGRKFAHAMFVHDAAQAVQQALLLVARYMKEEKFQMALVIAELVLQLVQIPSDQTLPPFEMSKLNFSLDAESDIDELLENIKSGLILKTCRNLVLSEPEPDHVSECLRMYVKLRCKLWSQSSEGVSESLGWYEWLSIHALASCIRSEGLDWLMVLIPMWRNADHPRAVAVVHHICTLIQDSSQTSPLLKNLYSAVHSVLWPTVVDALHDVQDLDLEELSAYPKHLFSTEFSSSAWESSAACCDGSNILANLDAACGIFGSTGFDCLMKLEIMPFDAAEGVVRHMMDIKVGLCISHFLLWCRLSAAIAIGDVKLFILEAVASQEHAAVLVAPSLKHVEACFNLAVERVKSAAASGDIEPSVSLLMDYIVVDSHLEGNVKDAVESILVANCKSLCSSIEEHLHTLGSNTGPKAAARAKAAFAKGLIIRIDELGIS